MAAKLSPVVEADGVTPHGWLFRCPGCALDPLDVGLHSVTTNPAAGRPAWGYNGDIERPTFNPSVLVRWEHGEQREKRVCHSFVRDGKIEYLNDCTHALAGKTVELPDWSEDL